MTIPKCRTVSNLSKDAIDAMTKVDARITWYLLWADCMSGQLPENIFEGDWNFGRIMVALENKVGVKVDYSCKSFIDDIKKEGDTNEPKSNNPKGETKAEKGLEK